MRSIFIISAGFAANLFCSASNATLLGEPVKGCWGNPVCFLAFVDPSNSYNNVRAEISNEDVEFSGGLVSPAGPIAGTELIQVSADFNDLSDKETAADFLSLNIKQTHPFVLLGEGFGTRFRFRRNAIEITKIEQTSFLPAGIPITNTNTDEDEHGFSVRFGAMQLGSVDPSDLEDLTTSFRISTRRTINVTNVVNSRDFGDKPNPEFPTVVITHGLQTSGISVGSFPLSNVFQSVLDQAKNQQANDLAFPGLNIVKYTWTEADTSGTDDPQGGFPAPFFKYNAAATATYTAGARLARILNHLLGSDYEAPLHMIGHSLGTAVIAHAASTAERRAFHFGDINQFTILDAPSNVNARLPNSGNNEFNSNWFHSNLSPSVVKFVDNFYGGRILICSNNILLCSSTPAFGGPIPSSNPRPAGERFLYDDHIDVPNTYSQAKISNETIWQSAAVLPDTFSLVRWAPPTILTMPLSSLNNVSGWSIDTGVALSEKLIFDGLAVDGISLIENSPTTMWSDLLFPLDATSFHFDFTVLTAGDGDSLQLFFNDILIWEFFSSPEFLNELLSVNLPTSMFIGEIVSVKFHLNSVGESNASFFVTNFSMTSLERSSIPEPATLLLFSIGLVLISFARRRKALDQSPLQH